ncbi:tol-pal system-associated acyl-CoA thioesterase [Bacteroidia bacterium]|nr:tol-pal system-associated acyl-CoA thioesterase [Bacteroidia bacterium]
MTQPHKFPFTIAYADTDAGGIAYHARYIEIAERARMNWLNGRIPPNGGVGFVIKELNIKYLTPLKLADDFVVETRMLKQGGASIVVEHKFIRGDEVCAAITGTAAYIGSDFKPKRIPPEYIAEIV